MRARWIIAVVAMAGAAGLTAEPLAHTGLDLGYRQLYNLQFHDAHATFHQWRSQHPHDPLGPASDAVTDLFAEMDRMQVLQAQFFTKDQDFLAGPAGPANPEFETDLEAAERLAAAAPANDTEAMYAQALCHGLRADYFGIVQKRYMASLGEMKRGQAVAARLLNIEPQNGDAYLAGGIENYMLGLKPAPVRWLLRLDGAETDKTEGLRELRRTAEEGHYLQPYAKILLAIAALRDNDPGTARELLGQLEEEFPLNPLYARELQRLSAVATFDPARTEIHFTLGAFLHTVHGEFALTLGRIEFDPAGGAASGRIEIGAASGKSGNDARDRDMHTKVLETERYPDIVFTPRQLTGTVAAEGTSQVSLQGTLRLHGEDHAMTLPLEVTIHGGQFTASTKATIPYVAWGLKNPSNAVLRVDKSVALTITTAGQITWPR